MSFENIWSTFQFDSTRPRIIDSLKEQAELLSSSTQGVLYAEVNQTDAFSDETGELGIIYDFNVYAPYLGNRRLKIFTVAEEPLNILLIDRVCKGPRIKCDNIVHLISEMKKLIGTPKIQEALQIFYNESLSERNHFSSLTNSAEEWARIIERDFYITYFPQSVKVSLKDKTEYHGYFQPFQDAAELRKQNKFRFVQWNDAGRLKSEYLAKGSMNHEFSVIVDCAQVENIEMTIPKEFQDSLRNRDNWNRN